MHELEDRIMGITEAEKSKMNEKMGSKQEQQPVTEATSDGNKVQCG